MKRILSAVIAIAMILGAMGITTFAAETEHVAAIGETEYATLQEAINAAGANDTVKLLADIELSDTVTVANGKVITLDLAGTTISGTSSESTSYALITNKGDLTIEDTVGNGTITYQYIGASSDRSFKWGNYTIANYGKLTVEGGKIENTTNMTGHMYSAIDNYVGATTVINGGTVSCLNYVAIRQVANSTTIGNTVEINGGTINGKYTLWPQNASDNSAIQNKATLTINGGTITATEGGVALFVSELCDTIIITKADEVKIAAPTGYEWVGSNGVYTLEKEAPAVASITKDGATTEYTTLQEAINAAGANETVKLLADIELSDTVTVAEGKVITLDLNGKKITATDNESGNYELFYNRGTLTVTGNGTIELTAKNDREWNALSSIFTNRGGVLTIENGTFTHQGGTSMAYVVDNNANSYGDATTVVKDGTLKSSYIAVHNRMDKYDGLSGKAVLDIKGGTFEGKYAIWGQVASQGVKAAINISGGTFTAQEGKAAVLVDTDTTGEITTAISGGTFSSDVSEYLAENHVALMNMDNKYVVGVKPTAKVTDEGATVVPGGSYTVYNKLGDATSSSNSEDMTLPFVMKYVADETADAGAASPYAEWYGDFVITITGLENGSFEGDGCYLAGNYGTFGWVKVPIDALKIEDGVRYPVMLSTIGDGQKYEYICSDVNTFKCALYLTPEVLEANPDIKVSLELCVVDNSKGGEAAQQALAAADSVYTYQSAVETFEDEKFVVDPYVKTKAALNTTLTRTEMAKAENGNFKIGMYAGIDNLEDYSKIGIRLYYPNDDGTLTELAHFSDNTVYESLSDRKGRVYATELGVYRIFGFIHEVSGEYAGKILHFQAYATTRSGETIYGKRWGIIVK